MNDYVYDVNDIKRKLKSLRERKGLTQQDFVDKFKEKTGLIVARPTVATWENINDKKGTLPSLAMLVDLCNFYKCDISYFFERKGEIISEETDKIATLLNTSERTVETLRDCDSYGAFLDKFIKNISKESVEAINNNENYWFLINDFLTSNSFEELANRTQQLVVNNVIDGAVKTVFTNKFLKNLKKYFDEFYFSEFPTEMTKTNFTKFLCKKIPSENFNSEEFVESNFLEEGKNCIYNLCEDFSAFSQNEQYALIIDFISDIAYDFFEKEKRIEVSVGRLRDIMYSLLMETIKNESNKIKKDLKNNPKKL